MTNKKDNIIKENTKDYMDVRRVRIPHPAPPTEHPPISARNIQHINGMKKNQLAKLTIFHTVKKLKLIAKSADLNNPNSIIDYLAEKKGKRSYIEALALAYNRYARYNGLKWKPPKIIRDSQPPYVPTAEELTVLISYAGKKYSLILSIFRDTGMRPIEIERMTRSWFNESQDSIRVATAKHGRGRLLKLKPSTADMLRKHIDANKSRLDENIFALSKTMRMRARLQDG